jgi:NADH:ubiquinone oxidoreductase subunit E
MEADIDFRGHLCHEICNRGPVIQINSNIYEEVSPVNLTPILDAHFQAAVTATDE